jgi:undecaprenyl-diphosphatase
MSHTEETSTTATDALRPVRRPVALGGAGVLGVALVVIVGVVIGHNAGVARGELTVLQWFSDHHTAPLDAVALAIAWLFSPTIASAITVLSGSAVLIVTHSLMRALTFVGIVVVCWSGSQIIKLFVERPRPDGGLLSNPLLTEHSFSYPSGHTSVTAALAIALIVTLRDSRGRTLTIVVGAIVTVLVALSRMYLGVHYPSDVSAAIVNVVSVAAIAVPVWLDLALPWLRSASARRPDAWARVDPGCPR